MDGALDISARALSRTKLSTRIYRLTNTKVIASHTPLPLATLAAPLRRAFSVINLHSLSQKILYSRFAIIPLEAAGKQAQPAGQLRLREVVRANILSESLKRAEHRTPHTRQNMSGIVSCPVLDKTKPECSDLNAIHPLCESKAKNTLITTISVCHMTPPRERMSRTRGRPITRTFPFHTPWLISYHMHHTYGHTAVD